MFTVSFTKKYYKSRVKREYNKQSTTNIHNQLNIKGDHFFFHNTIIEICFYSIESVVILIKFDIVFRLKKFK